jgi:hypothetical protein
MVSELYRDYDAVPLRPRKGERGAAVNHVKKGAARKRGLEVVFDPKAHRCAASFVRAVNVQAFLCIPSPGVCSLHEKPSHAASAADEPDPTVPPPCPTPAGTL